MAFFKMRRSELTPLPVDAYLPEIIDRLGVERNLVIEAEPGAGKTTRVPPALLDSVLAHEGEVWVLEPRRLAARLAAGRAAAERGEPLGGTIGYQVRFEDVSGPHTRLRYVTEGVFTRRLLRDPSLKSVKAVVLDEFHERRLQGDVALALLRKLQTGTRPDLRIVVMSATIDAVPVREFLGGAPTLKIPGRTFDIRVEHISGPDSRPLADQVAGALGRLLKDGLHGDVLVFLPGAAEIRRAAEACEAMAAREDVLIAPLHGELPVAEQDRAVRPSDRRKIILSTNVAESSVTIDGVTAVVDSGLARIAVHSPWSGLQRLTIGKISRASAVQRAGRAGRTQPGRCLRLYTAADFAARLEFDQPECARSDLAETVLELHAAGVRDARAFGWYESPPREAIGAAEDLLKRLGAILDDGSLTTTGRQMIRFPLHPRLSRILIECASCGAERDGAITAAILSERDILERNLFGAAGAERGARKQGKARSGPSDLLDRLDLFNEAELSRFSPDVLHRLGLDTGAVNAVNRVRRRLLALLRRTGENAVFADKNTGAFNTRAFNDEISVQGANRERALLAAILTGFPDRVARRRATARQKGSQEIEVLLCGGGQATLSGHSVVTQSEFLVAVEAGEKQSGRSSGVEIRLASAIDAEMLFEMYFERLREVESVVWNDKSERAESVRRLFYDDLIIDETAAGVASGEPAWRLLGEKALSRGPAAFLDLNELECTLARIEFAASVDSSGGWPDQMPDADSVLIALCKGRSSFAELRETARRGDWREALLGRLGPAQRRRLNLLAPERVSIGPRKQVRVEYERGKTPWVASRIQDFFGLRQGPRIADGSVPLVLHLLAPNNRPVQVTSDLEGFWIRHYGNVRRELSRRYPRHAWPDNPLAQ